MKKSITGNFSSLIALLSAKASSDFVYTNASQVISLGVSFVTSVIVADRLGLNQLGVYVLILSIASFISTLADVGVGQTAIRYASVALAKSETSKCSEVLAWSINVRITFAVASMVSGVFFANWLGSHLWEQGIFKDFLLQAFVLGSVITLQQCANAYFHTHQNFRFLSLTVFINSALILSGILAMAYLDFFSLKILIFVSIFSSLATFALVVIKTPWREIYKYNDQSRLFHSLSLKLQVLEKASGPADARYAVRPQTFVTYLLASSLLVTIFTRLDVWMIGAMLTEADVGVYKLASYFAIPLALAVGSLNTILWPRASRLASEVSIRNFVKKTVQVSMLLMLPAFIYMFLLLWLPTLVFPRYANIISGLAIALCFRYVIAMLITPAAVVGYTIGMSRIYVLVNFLQLIIIIAINFYFIDRLGMYAPALSLIASELISVLIIWPLMFMRVRNLS